MKNNTYNLQWLLNKVEKKENVKYLFFWGHAASKDGSLSKSCFSQWWASAFIVDGVSYATAEHWMMAKKAELFGLTRSLLPIGIATIELLGAK